MGGLAYDIHIDGDYAYVASFDSGLNIYDITDQANPSFEGSYSTSPAFAKKVFVKGNYAYLTTSVDALHIVDISDKSNPSLSGDYDDGYEAEEVYVQNNYTYLAGAYGGLRILFTVSPSSPIFEAEYTTADRVIDVHIQGDYSYIVDSNEGFMIIDTTFHNNPILASTYDILITNASSLFVDNDYAFVGDNGTKSVYALNISDKANPELIDLFIASETITDLHFDDTYLYVTNDFDGIKILNFD
jgi:hypothetical protein